MPLRDPHTLGLLLATWPGEGCGAGPQKRLLQGGPCASPKSLTGG